MRGAALLSPKVARGVAGRREWRGQLARLPRPEPGRLRVHVHAASVGEFEQAKPIIERLRALRPDTVVTASFFSPSGYEQQGKWEHLAAASYLPEERAGEMRAFLDRVAPDLLLIVRYDLWPELLVEAENRKIPTVLVCGVLRAGTARFRPVIRGFFRWLYSRLSLIHVVEEADASALAALGVDVPREVSGDTRYDRVVERALAPVELPWLDPALVAGRTILVAGSTWPPDEERLAALNDLPGILPVIVPHEPDAAHVEGALARFPGAVTLSDIERREAGAAPRAIVIDRTGLLSALYRIGEIAYVGGAFGEGVHSVLEPAAYALPVFSGPGIERSRDAVALEREGGLTVIRAGEELRREVERLVGEPERRRELAGRVERFVRENVGATGRIVDSLGRHGWLEAGPR